MRRLALVLLLGACNRSFTPSYRVEGLRVLAVKAEPPEAAPGTMTTLTALVVDTTGHAIDVAWAACTEPAIPGMGIVNNDCIQSDSAPYLLPLGMGLSTPATVPMIDPNIFAPPDASGGLYLPVRARATTAADRVDAIYQLRLTGTAPPNHNPTLDAVLVVQPDGSTVPLEEATPLDVAQFQEVTLRATFTPDSAEMYEGQGHTLTEQLRAAWFSTAGTFTESATGPDKPDTIFRANEALPPAGGTIDIWIVGRDERGGTDFLHRVLHFRG